MTGFIFSIIAGIAMTIQGVFNTRVSEKIGLWETTLLVQGTAFLFSIIVYFILRKGDMTKISSVNKFYLIGGIIGVIITYTVMKGIGNLGPIVAIMIILISQLLSAAIVDAFGLFDTPKLAFSLNEWIGLAFMLVGMFIFKFIQ